MPRKPTMLGETRKWIRDNATWLTRDHAPLVHQLKMLAETEDLELQTGGRVQSATASAYRLTFGALMGMRDEDDIPLPVPAQPAPAADEAQADEAADDELFDPLP